MTRSRFRRWIRLEWFGLPFYFDHCWRVLTEVYRQDPRQLKVSISVPSFGFSLWLLADPSAYDSPGYRYLMPLLPPHILSAVFALHGLGLVWRVLSLSRQMGWSILFGVGGMFLYFGYPLCVWWDIERITGPGIGMLGWGVVSAWITTRIGSGEDRSGP